MSLKIICVLNIIAVIIFMICRMFYNTSLLYTMISLAFILLEILTAIFVLTGKIN